MGFGEGFGDQMGKEAAGCLSTGVGFLIVVFVLFSLIQGCVGG